jgi:hypothetical protein
LRTQFYGIVERANAIIGHFRPVARAAVLAKPRLAPPLLAKAVFAMNPTRLRMPRQVTAWRDSALCVIE